LPHYPLLLGRSTELASVVKSELFELEEKSNVRVGGSIFPFNSDISVTGVLQALPTHFTDEIPRRASGTRPFCLVETDFSGKVKNKRPQYYKKSIYYDKENDWGVFMHG
jgi:CRISPR-associated protein Cas5t